MICFQFILVKYSSSEPITIARHFGKKEKIGELTVTNNDHTWERTIHPIYTLCNEGY